MSAEQMHSGSLNSAPAVSGLLFFDHQTTRRTGASRTDRRGSWSGVCLSPTIGQWSARSGQWVRNQTPTSGTPTFSPLIPLIAAYYVRLASTVLSKTLPRAPTDLMKGEFTLLSREGQRDERHIKSRSTHNPHMFSPPQGIALARPLLSQNPS